jgi:hypothetical protein
MMAMDVAVVANGIFEKCVATRIFDCVWLLLHQDFFLFPYSYATTLLHHKSAEMASTFALSDDAGENMQCFLVAACCDTTFGVCAEILNVPQFPALVVPNGVLFGSSSIIRGIALQRSKAPEEFDEDWFQDALDIEEFYIRPACKSLSSGKCKRSAITPCMG